MKKGWQTKTLGEMCEMYQPKTISGKEMVADGAYPVFGANGVIGRYNQFNHEEPQLLITCRGATCGSVNISEPRSWVTGNAMVVRPKSESLAMRYLEYLFRGGIDISKAITGAAQPQITRTNLEPLEISYPESLAEQQRIVVLLDEAFAGLATAKANAERNLQNARAIFESHLQTVFSERGVGWDKVAIGEVAEVYDGPHATPKTVDKGPIFLGISSLQDGKINLGETRHVTPEDFQLWTRRVKPQADDVVFSYETRLGQAAIIPSGLDCCLGRRMALVRPSATRLDSTFFVHQYISPPFRSYLEDKIVRGATVDRIPLKDFPTYLICLPSIDKQRAIAGQLEVLRSETQHLTHLYERKLAALEELKKTLLHQAFNGVL